ncbi:hypothetical protein [Streptomyces sasae]|nr:hypothetical protein [Streptomyces sasae]
MTHMPLDHQSKAAVALMCGTACGALGIAGLARWLGDWTVD